MKAFYASILLILLASYVAAETITDINLWIGADGYTWVEERIVVSDSSTTQCQAILPRHVNDFSIADELGRLNYTLTSDGRYDIVNYTLRPMENGSESNIWIKYGTPQLTRKDGLNWTISYYTPANERQTIVRVNFPVGGKFVSLEPETLLRSFEKYAVWIFPQENYLDFNCTYEYSGNNSWSGTVNTSANHSTTTVPQPVNRPFDPTTIAVILFALILIFGIVYVAVRMELFKKQMKDEKNEEQITVSVEKESAVKGPSIVGDSLSYDIEGSVGKKGKKSVKESIMKMLEDNEMVIVKIMEGSDEDELTQAYVHKITGIPKSSLSDIIKRLEKRNILESTSQGRTKWLKLQKWVLE